MTCRLRIYAKKKNIRQHRKQDSCEMLRFRPDATTPNTRASVWKLLKSDQQHTQTCCSMLHSTLIAICANNKKSTLLPSTEQTFDRTTRLPHRMPKTIFQTYLWRQNAQEEEKKKESKKERESDSKKIIKQQLSIQFVFHVRTTVFRMCNFAQRKRKFWNDFCFFQFFDNHFLYYGSYSTSVDQICIINYFFLFRARNFAVIK